MSSHMNNVYHKNPSCHLLKGIEKGADLTSLSVGFKSSFSGIASACIDRIREMVITPSLTPYYEAKCVFSNTTNPQSGQNCFL